MPDEDKTFSGSFVLDLRIWWRQVHTLYLISARFYNNVIGSLRFDYESEIEYE